MLGSILLPAALQSHSTKPSSGTRRNTYTAVTGSSTLPARRNSLATTPAAQTAPLQLKSVTLSGGMDSRHYRPSSPRRAYNPARSSTGTFADPYSSYDYAAYRPTSPRSSADRLSSASHHHSNSSYASYTPSSSISSRASGLKYDSYSTRPRRNTEDRMSRPNVASLTSLPLRTPYTQDHRPSSPLTQPRSSHGDTYITHASSRQDSGSSHKKIYSVDSSHTAKLVAETDTIESPRHRDSGYGAITSGRSSYHPTSSKPSRHAHADLGDNGYSYTDPASMYRDTEPAWRRPRAGSMERGSRPSSMIVDRPLRSSARELGPPPSTRGFDKINGGIPRSSGRSNSIERRDRYQDPYSSDSGPHRSSSTRHAPAVHQEPPRERETRRAETYDDYGRGREVEIKRHSTHDRGFEDHQVASRGFGIATGPPPSVHDQYALDRQPLHATHDPQRAPPVDYAPSAYHSDRGAESRMPEPRRPERPVSYEPPRPERPRAEHRRDDSRQDGNRESRAVPVAAGAIAGMAATAGIAAAAGKAKEREREERSSSEERERQRRREYDERDRRDDRHDDRERRDERRSSRLPEERREALPPPPPPQPAPPVAAPAYAMAQEADRPKSRDRPYPNEENPPPKPLRKPSPEGSEVERPRHYAERDSDRGRKDPAPPAAALDPDEEYRRRIAQAEKEAEQSRRAAADRQDSDSDGGRDRRRRRDRADRERSRSRSRGRDERSRASPPSQGPSRYSDRELVDEPESDKLNPDAPGKSVQIVVPRKDQSPPIKGILRKPTEKFPEDPEPIREGVAPHKDSLKGREIPAGARWTRIDRKLVNPEALERAKERFEERQDCVIVLRVLTKEEIQKLADKTKAIREERGTCTCHACWTALTCGQRRSTSASAATAIGAATAETEMARTATAMDAADVMTTRATTTTWPAKESGSEIAQRCWSLLGDSVMRSRAPSSIVS